jgi:hypothetical protein
MRKIQVFPAFQHMLKLISINWRVAATFSLPWLALIAAMNAGMLSSIQNFKSFNPYSIIPLVVGYFGTCSITVSWHRYILLDEISPQFRIDRPVWAFLLRSMMIGLICFAPLLILSIVFDRLPSIFLLLWVALSLWGLTIFTRMSLCTVATATGNEPFSIKNSLALTQNNNWPILGLLLSNTLLILMTILAYVVAISLATSIAPGLEKPATVLFGIPMQFVVMLLNASLQTTLYGYFVEGRDFS